MSQGPFTELTLATHGRVHDARDRALIEGARQADVGADALDDVLVAPLAQLGDHVGVGHLRARHGHHVRLALGDHLLGHLGVADPADDEDLGAMPDDLLGLLGEGYEQALGHAHRRHGDMQRVIAAARDVEEVEQPR